MQCNPAIVLSVGILLSTTARAAEKTTGFSVKQEADGVSVLIDGELFTRYLTQSGTRPVLWPLIGPTGQPMTRAYPVAEKGPDDATDHIHHRSVWIGYEGVNGADFWHEPDPSVIRPLGLGKQVHRGFTTVEALGKNARIVAETDWLDAGGDPVCSDRRTLVFGADGNQRWIDYQTDLIASAGPLKIGDSKEGLFALRIAPTMKVDAHLGGKIVTSRGLTDADAWGKHAEWVDYHGPINGETVGIAMMAHPRSFAPAPRWHVRTYGLFAANPFGELAFTKPESNMSKRPLRVELAEGDSLRLRYKIILHRGDEREARIAHQYKVYATP